MRVPCGLGVYVCIWTISHIYRKEILSDPNALYYAVEGCFQTEIFSYRYRTLEIVSQVCEIVGCDC